MWRRTCTLARAALSVRFPSRSTCTVPQCSLGAIRYMPSPVRRELSTGKAIVQTIRKRENLEESVDAFKEKRVDYGESENGVVKERVDYGENLEETRRGNNGRGVEEEVPSTRQLFYHALRRGIPMIGFGAMDNFVMINAGEAIDLSIGVSFGLSTITAAAIGQIFSDVAGTTFGGVVDAWAAKLRIPSPDFSHAQSQMQVTAFAGTVGGIVGVLLGCFLGMGCLLFKDTEKAARLKKEREMKTIFSFVMQHAKNVVDAERASLWLYDRKNKQFHTCFATDSDDAMTTIHLPENVGLVGRVHRTRTSIIVQNAYDDPDFHPDVDKITGFRTQSVLCCPVLSPDSGELLGVIQMLNKKRQSVDPHAPSRLAPSSRAAQLAEGSHSSSPPVLGYIDEAADIESSPEFTDYDLSVAELLAEHVAVFMRVVDGDDD